MDIPTIASELYQLTFQLIDTETRPCRVRLDDRRTMMIGVSNSVSGALGWGVFCVCFNLSQTNVTYWYSHSPSEDKTKPVSPRIPFLMEFLSAARAKAAKHLP